MLIRFFIASAVFFGALSSSPAYANSQINKPNRQAATTDEINTYVNISVTTFCEARGHKIDFKKSMSIAVAAQGYPIFAKHGGLVPGSEKPLEEKQFINNAVPIVMIGSLNACPEMIPADEKAKFEKALSEAKRR